MSNTVLPYALSRNHRLEVFISIYGRLVEDALRAEITRVHVDGSLPLDVVKRSAGDSSGAIWAVEMAIRRMPYRTKLSAGIT